MNKKPFKIFAVVMLLLGSCAYINAQVTIGANAVPNATLDVVAISPMGDTPAGIIPPRVDRATLNENESKYGINQNGAIVYVSNLNGTNTGKSVHVTALGLHYFDGEFWRPIGSGGDGDAAPELSYLLIENDQHYDLSDVGQYGNVTAIWNPSVGAGKIILPTAGIPIGRTISVACGGAGNVTLWVNSSTPVNASSHYLINGNAGQTMTVNNSHTTYIYVGNGKWLCINYY